MHILRHKKKEIDLALSLRLANLPNNATLELYELDGTAASKRVVSVSLQTGDCKRAVLETGCTVNLLDLLKKFEDRLSQRLCSGCAGADPTLPCHPASDQTIDSYDQMVPGA